MRELNMDSLLFESFFKFKNFYLYYLVSSLLNFNLWGQSAISDCGEETIKACHQEVSAIGKNPAAGGYVAVAIQCYNQIAPAVISCKDAQAKLRATEGNFYYSAAGTPVAADVGANAGSITGADAGATFTSCSNQLKGAEKLCYKPGAVTCAQLAVNLSWTCQQNALAANEKVAQGQQVAKAADALKSNWKPLLIGAAVGAGAMALMGGKKGGDGGGTPPPAPKPDNKLPDLKLNGSTTSAAPTPSVVYYPPSNNNGSLGNPAVIGPTTSTSTPADTVKVAGITPSTSFASGQGSSIGPDTSSRTISSSGSATPASTSEGSLGSTDSDGGVFSGGSDSASLVDTSGKSAGGGGGFSGGMDGGSGSSAQAASADGTMLTGIPGGKNDPQSAKVKALASKKAKVAQTQSRTTIPKPLRRSSATPPVKKDLKQYMRSKHLIK